ncbi:MAG: hypothetical protein ACLQBD_30530 [Syntrophobacteraceae bacterium]
MIKLRAQDGSYSVPILTALFVIFLLILAAHSLVITGAYIILCLWTLLGPKQAIQALSLNYTILLLNPAVFHLPVEAGVFRWLILFIAGLRVLPTASSRTLRYLIPLVLFFLAVTALASVTSPIFLISFLKVMIFSYYAATVLTAFDTMDERSREQLKVWFFCLPVAWVLLSLPLLALGSGYLATGFRGIFNHPQAFGTALAPAAAYLFARLILCKGPHSPWLWVLGTIYTAMIVLSRARTGMLALLLGLGATMVFGLCSSRRELMQLAPARTLLKVGASTAFIIILLATSSVFSKRVEGFWLKGENEKSVERALYNSRGAAAIQHWERFLEKPLTGHGFGIDLAHGSGKNVGTFLGIPISAPTEQGFLPIAILEEVGLVGMAFLVPFLVFLVQGALAQQDVRLIAMFFTCLFINAGEAVFFSPGQLGGYLWLLIGLSTAAGRRLQAEHET